MNKSDAELVAACLRGDPHAFEEIVRRYQGQVFRILYRYLGRREEVEDLAQEVFLKLFQSLERYDQGRPLGAWLTRIAVNCCLDERRRARHRHLQLFSDLTPQEEEDLGSYFDRFQQGEFLTDGEAERSLHLLQRLLNQLPAKDKMAFLLREVEGLDYAHIAQAMKSTELAVRIRVSRTRKKLQRRMERLLQNRGRG